MTESVSKATVQRKFQKVENRVYELERKLRTNTLGKPPRTRSGGSKEYATTVIAASNSTEHGKAAADYVCDGASDQDVINTALAEVSPFGGVMLLEGEFFSDGEIQVPEFRTFRGQGASSQIVRSGADGNIIVQGEDESLVCDMLLTSSGGDNGVFCYGWRTVTERLRINGCQIGLWLNGGYGEVCGNIIKNSVEFAIYDDSSDRYVVRSNHLLEGAGDGLYIVNGSRGSALGNFIEAFASNGIRIAGGDWQVNDNYVGDCVGHGVFLAASDHCMIVGNHLLANGSDSVHDNIHVNGDYNMVQGNLCREGGVGTRYGVRVGAGTGNFVTNNDLYDSGITANFSDAGTATVTTAGNRV